VSQPAGWSPTGGPPAGAAGTDELADRVVAAVRAVPGVADLHAGPFGEVATYLRGRRVAGVQLRGDRCAVHVVVFWGAPVLATADLVVAAVRPLVGGVVDVTVEDVVPVAGTVP